MTKTQIKLIDTYRAIFPKESYQKISLKTQIQQTRLFRIFNGCEMKISEFETLNNIIRATTQSTHSDFQKISDTCSQILPIDSINDLVQEMSYLINLRGGSKW
jgi:hypothetical protein